MKKFVYPAIIYNDADANVYVVAIDELSLFVEGDSVEDAHASMNEALTSYVTTALEFGYDIPEAQNFNIVAAKNPKNLVILVEAHIDENKLKKFAE